MSKTSYRKKKKNDILVDSNDYKNDSEIPLSPAERFNLFKQTIEHSRTMAAKFEQSLSFDLDDFQAEAIDALENGDNVLVAAPTGAGKTVVADFAVFLGVNRGVKTFYTTPIKVL